MTYLKLKVHANARVNELVAKGSDTFVIKVQEPAENGRANHAALALLSAHLGVATSRLWIVKGAHSPSKIIQVCKKQY